MSFFWRAFKNKSGVHHCIHEQQSAEPAQTGREEPVLETAVVRPLNHENPSDTAEASPNGVVDQEITRDSNGRCLICRQEQLAARRYRIRVIIGQYHCPTTLPHPKQETRHLFSLCPPGSRHDYRCLRTL